MSSARRRRAGIMTVKKTALDLCCGACGNPLSPGGGWGCVTCQEAWDKKRARIENEEAQFQANNETYAKIIAAEVWRTKPITKKGNDAPPTNKTYKEFLDDFVAKHGLCCRAGASSQADWTDDFGGWGKVVRMLEDWPAIVENRGT